MLGTGCGCTMGEEEFGLRLLKHNEHSFSIAVHTKRPAPWITVLHPVYVCVCVCVNVVPVLFMSLGVVPTTTTTAAAAAAKKGRFALRPPGSCHAVGATSRF